MKRYKWLVISLVIFLSGIAFVPVMAFPWTEKIDWQSFALAYTNEPVIFYVTTTADEPDAVFGDGDCKTASEECSLRAAIDEANRLEDLNAEVIIDLPPGTYMLSRTDPVFPDFHLRIWRYSSYPVIIRGHEGENAIIEGDGFASIFIIQYTVEFRNVTIQNGGGGYLEPGAIMVRWLSDLRLNNCVLQDNHGYDGGAINITGPESYLTIQNCTITGNNADNNGGAIAATTTDIIIRESTISGNTAAANGGGILAAGGTAQIINSTISGNSANSGGGWFQTNGVANFFNTTISYNSAALSGGGIRLGDSITGLVKLSNSILGQNVNVDSPDCVIDNPSAMVSIITNGASLIGSTAGCPVVTLTGDLVDLDPALGPLQDNGGPTKTHALLPDSPAINTGDPGGCKDFLDQVLTTDQRGFPRPSGSVDTRCDIGAYEWEGPFNQVFLPIIVR